LNYETIIDYLVDFIYIVGTPELFDEKITEATLTIENYRATLPSDFLEPIQLSIDKYMARHSPDTHGNFYSEVDAFLGQDISRQSQEVMYKIKGDYIYTSKESGEILMVYKAIMVDSDESSDDYGLPMVPDDPVFMLAFQSYVDVQWIRQQWRSGKIDQRVLEEAKQTYAWNVGRYETHAKKLDLGKMESISKLFRSIQYKTNEFNTRFRHLGVK